MTARNLKLRAIENGVYDKFHLTRTRFEIPPDLMTTDMGNSYLAMRTVLKDSITHLPVDTQQNPNEVPVFFCLGDGITAYDGTCLFRTAKLFNKATGAVIEELNYNNLRCNTFKEFTTDFDNLASDTIETGLGIPDALLNNLQSTYTLWTNAERNTVELHIPLKSLFPSLNTPFFQLSAVGGLTVDLEWDTTHPLVMSYSNPELVIPPPPVLATGNIGFNTVEQEEASWLVREQVNSQFAPIEKPFAVERPEYWDFLRVNPDVSFEDRYWFNELGEVYGLPDASGNYAGVDLYKWAPKRKHYIQADLVQLTLTPLSVDANYFVELRTALLDGEANEIPFTFADQIVGQSGDNLQFYNKHTPCRLLTDDIIGARFDGIVAPLATPNKKGLDPVGLALLLPTKANFITLKDLNTIAVSASNEAIMLKAGLLTEVDGVVVANTQTTFKLYLQSYGAGTEIYMVPDMLEDVLTVETRITNQKYQIPYGEDERINVELYEKVGSGGIITFNRSMNLNYVEDVRPAHDYLHISNTIGGDPKTIVEANAMYLFFQDVRYVRPLVETLPHYPSCDLAEMVLVQYPPAKTPMPKFYRTMTVEPFVIPRDMAEHVQNFMLQPNVYNAWVLLPYESVDTNISTSPSLISGDGNVLKFRATIDEVDVVNKDITLGSFPDSLYWDKLADAFSNSAMPMKTLNGIASGAIGANQLRPTRVFPVRIYGGLVNGVVSFSNFMKRLQIRLDAPNGEYIKFGTAYLYKEMYKAW